MVGIDRSSVAWSALVDDGGRIKRAWNRTGAVLQGGMCAVGGDGAGLFFGRDSWGGVGILRVSADGNSQWTSIGLKASQDPSCSQMGDQVLIGAVDEEGRAYVDQCTVSSSQCGQWRYMAAAVQSAAVAMWDKDYYLFTRTSDNSVARWSSATGWQGVIWGSLARGRLIGLSGD
jgi:hypothetical protein